MNVKELEKLHKTVSEELSVYQSKSRKLNRAKEIVDREVSIRRSFIYSIEELINIEQEKE